MRTITLPTALLIGSVISVGAAWAQPQKQRARSLPTYTSTETIRGSYSAAREAPQFSVPFGGPAARQQGSYYSTHPLGGGGGGSP